MGRVAGFQFVVFRNRQFRRPFDKTISQERAFVAKGFDSVFNLLPRGGQGELTEEQKGLVEERNRFRREKNFPEADRVRKLLLDQGILIEDTRNGVRWKRA